LRFGAGQVLLAAEDRMLAAQRDQPRRVLAQPHIGRVPVEPGDLVVLAVGVVVAALGPAHLVAAE